MLLIRIHFKGFNSKAINFHKYLELIVYYMKNEELM